MKKSYTKPEIYFENFTLSTNIASNCDRPFSLQAQFVCAIPDANNLGMGIFDPNRGGGCVIPGDQDAMYDGFCYHVPTENNMLFMS